MFKFNSLLSCTRSRLAAIKSFSVDCFLLWERENIVGGGIRIYFKSACWFRAWVLRRVAVKSGVGVVYLCRFLLKTQNGWWKNKKNKLLKRKRIKTRIYVLLDIKNSKPTHTCTRSNVRTMGVVATVDFFFAMVVCFAAAFFLSRRDSLLLLRTIFPPSLPPPFFHLSLSLISSLSFSLSLPFFVFSRIFSFNFLPHSFRAFSLLCVDDFDVCFCCSLFKYYI